MVGVAASQGPEVRSEDGRHSVPSQPHDDVLSGDARHIPAMSTQLPQIQKQIMYSTAYRLLYGYIWYKRTKITHAADIHIDKLAGPKELKWL